MTKILKSSTLRVVTLPLLGALGALAGVMFPVGHDAFCRGLPGLVL